MFSMTCFYFNFKNNFINVDYVFLNFKNGPTVCNLSSEFLLKSFHALS